MVLFPNQGVSLSVVLSVAPPPPEHAGLRSLMASCSVFRVTPLGILRTFNTPVRSNRHLLQLIKKPVLISPQLPPRPSRASIAPPRGPTLNRSL